MPDLLLIINSKVYFIEAKVQQETGAKVLKHPFKGPQISIMRQVRIAGGFSYGAIGTPNSMLWLLHPCDIPMSGNLSLKELSETAFPVFKKDHIWRIDQWENLFHEFGKSNLLSKKMTQNLP